MNHRKGLIKKIVEYALPWAVLAILLIYTYAKFFHHSYGFAWANGTIDYVFVNQEGPTLMAGDRLVQIGPLSWDAYQADLRRTFFEGARPGEVVPVMVKRDDTILTIPWKLPGPNQDELQSQVFSEWPIAYFFWLAGVLTVLFLRPKDERWQLLLAFNFLTAIWLGVGGGASGYHVWNSAIVLRMTIWMSVPVYLHFHWVFPRPLGKLPPFMIRAGYGAALVLAIAQGFQLFSSSLYFLGFLVAILGSLVLLVVHAIRQPDVRRDLRPILATTLFVIVPLFILAMIQTYYRMHFRIDSLGLIPFPLLPLSYLYIAYRRQLGDLELRVNRIISLYLFMILLGLAGLILITLTYPKFTSPNAVVVIWLMSIVLVAVISTLGFPPFQSFVESRLLGIPHPPTNLQKVYSERIITSISFPALTKLLSDEIFPSLLVRQFVFLRLDSEPLKLVTAIGVKEEQIPERLALPSLFSQAGRYMPPELSDKSQPLSWVRLALPLKVGDETIGIWLLGHRDPDDLYSQTEIPIIQTLANQTAIAVSNIIQTEHLRAIYQADINRHEQERLHLALDLHDSILNQLAALLMNLDESAMTPDFQKAYDMLARRLREIVSDLRPPMLNYGLKPAIESLAEALMERRGNNLKVSVALQADENRHIPLTELHVYRMVQEACENSMRHAQAGNILISGRLDQKQVDLQVEDDGVGFEAQNGLELEGLIANKHFGLAGMVERAKLIGAEVKIHSTPGNGTKIQITRRDDSEQALSQHPEFL